MNEKIIKVLLAAAFMCCIAGCSYSSREISVLVESADASADYSDTQSISEDRYVYNLLNEDEKKAYDEELNAILEFEEKAVLSTDDEEVMKRAYDAIMCDYGGLFWINGYSYSKRSYEGALLVFYPGYIMSEDEAGKYQAKVDEAVDVFLQGVSVTDSDYYKAKYVFEELAKTTEYSEDADQNQNILSVLLYHKSVCYGYARAAHYIFYQLNIPSIIVLGSTKESGEINHAWNLVKLDGEYYCMDVTLGDVNGTDGAPDYSYMCATDEGFSPDHFYSGEFDLPECTETADSYKEREASNVQ